MLCYITCLYEINKMIKRPTVDDPVIVWNTTSRSNCHSPTQPNLKVGIDKVMGWPTPHHPPTETFKALPGNPGS